MSDSPEAKPKPNDLGEESRPEKSTWGDMTPEERAQSDAAAACRVTNAGGDSSALR